MSMKPPPKPQNTPATPEQVAMFGHIAARLRAELTRRNWSIREFNLALHRSPGHTGVYNWLSGKGGPAPRARAEVSKLFDIPEEELTRRPRNAVVKAPKVPTAVPHPPMATPVVASAGKRTAEVLSFVINDAGESRIRLDVTLPVSQGMPLLRMLLDAGLVLGQTPEDTH